MFEDDADVACQGGPFRAAHAFDLLDDVRPVDGVVRPYSVRVLAQELRLAFAPQQDVVFVEIGHGLGSRVWARAYTGGPAGRYVGGFVNLAVCVHRFRQGGWACRCWMDFAWRRWVRVWRRRCAGGS